AVFVRARHGVLRWEPGAEPRPLAQELRGVDPVTGTTLTVEATGGGDGEPTGGGPTFVVTRPDRSMARLAVDRSAMLAPGGTRLWALRYSPRALTLYDVDSGAAVTHPLPECQTELAGPTRPCWEDADHLLFMTTGPSRAA